MKTTFGKIRNDVEVMRAVAVAKKQHDIPYVTIMMAVLIIVWFVATMRLVFAQHAFTSVWDFLIPAPMWYAVDAQLGAITPDMYAHGEYWRLVTAMFVHIGVLHVVINLSCFFALVDFERVFGHWRFLLIYGVSGLVGGACSWFLLLLFHAPLTAGASTALYGVFCAYGMVYFVHFRASHLSRCVVFLLALGLYLPFAFIGNPFGHIPAALTGIGLIWLMMPALERRLLRK